MAGLVAEVVEKEDPGVIPILQLQPLQADLYPEPMATQEKMAAVPGKVARVEAFSI
jgi:hypothetical protein